MVNKAQLFSLPFILIFALVVGALILLFGFNMIDNLVQTGKAAETTKFVTGFRNDVQRYYFFERGSQKVVNVNLPGDIMYICFKDASMTEKTDMLDTKSTFMLQNDRQNNLFFFPAGRYKPVSVNNLGSPELKTYCTGNGNSVIIRSEGEYVSIVST